MKIHCHEVLPQTEEARSIGRVGGIIIGFYDWSSVFTGTDAEPEVVLQVHSDRPQDLAARLQKVLAFLLENPSIVEKACGDR